MVISRIKWSELKTSDYRKELKQRNKKVAENEDDHGYNGRMKKKSGERQATAGSDGGGSSMKNVMRLNLCQDRRAW